MHSAHIEHFFRCTHVNVIVNYCDPTVLLFCSNFSRKHLCNSPSLCLAAVTSESPLHTPSFIHHTAATLLRLLGFVCQAMARCSPTSRCLREHEAQSPERSLRFCPQRPLRAQRCIGHAISSIVTPGNPDKEIKKTFRRLTATAHPICCRTKNRWPSPQRREVLPLHL